MYRNEKLYLASDSPQNKIKIKSITLRAPIPVWDF